MGGAGTGSRPRGRAHGTAAVVLACAAWLVGCFPVDHQAPVAYLYVEWDRDVTLTLVGVEKPQEVSAGGSHVIRGADGDRLYGADDCYGDGFVLTETTTGHEVGR